MQPCVTFDDAVDGIAPRLPCESKRQRERTRIALAGLMADGHVQHVDGWLWLL
jgi:hypothetical protein